MDFLSIVDDANYGLSEDISTWADQIQQVFEQKFTSLNSFTPQVDIKKINPKGYGYGTISVKHGSLTIFFPVIINRFKLDPIDTFILNNRYYPASNKMLSLVFTGTFGSLAGRTSDDQRISQTMTNYLFSPYYFPTGVKNASSYVLPLEHPVDKNKTKDFLTKVAYSLTNDLIKDVIKELKDPRILNIVKSVPTLTDFFSNLNGIPSNQQMASRAAVSYPKNIVQFRYDNGDYYVLLNSQDMYSPSEVAIPAGNIRDAIRQLTGVVDENKITDIIENVANDGALTETLPTFRAGTIKIIDSSSPLKPAVLTTQGNALVQDDNGKYRTGTIFTQIVPFAALQDAVKSSIAYRNYIYVRSQILRNLDARLQYKVYVDSAVGMVSENFIGFKVSDRSLVPIALPSAGDFGFLYSGKSGTITEPFLIISLTSESQLATGSDPAARSVYKASIQTTTGSPYNIVWDVMHNDISFIKINKLIQAGTNMGLMSPDMDKTITISFSAGKYAMSAPEEMNTWSSEAFGDYSPAKVFNFNRLSDSDLDFMLTSGGASIKEAAAIKYYITKHGSAEVHGLKFTKPSSRAERLKSASSLKKSIPRQSLELVKLAEGMDDADATISEIFGLSLMTPENVSEFIEEIPTYNIIMHNISKYIIFARMALKDIDLTSALKLRDTLLDVIQQLVLLNYRISNNTQKEVNGE